MLCVTSDSETVHLFKLLPPSSSSSPSHPPTIMAALLPERVGEAWESIRDFAHIKLPSSNLPSLCAISTYRATISAHPLILLAPRPTS